MKKPPGSRRAFLPSPGWGEGVGEGQGVRGYFFLMFLKKSAIEPKPEPPLPPDNLL